jgi:hypothetical protein
MTEEEHDDFNDDKTYDGKQYDAAVANDDDDDDDHHHHHHSRVGECDHDADDDKKCRQF